MNAQTFNTIGNLWFFKTLALRTWLLVALTTLILCGNLKAQTRYSVTTVTNIGIGALNVNQFNGGRPMNNNGDVVVTSLDENGQFAYVYKSDGTTTRIDRPGYYLAPIGINDSGQVAFNGQNLNGGPNLVLIYTPHQGFQQIGTNVYAQSLNDLGQVVAYGQNDNDVNFHTYVLGPGGGERSAWHSLYGAGGAINDLGMIAGSENILGTGATHAFLESGGLHDLSNAPGDERRISYAEGINNLGHVAGIGYYFNDDLYGYGTGMLWKDGQQLVLPKLPDSSISNRCECFSINDSDVLVGDCERPVLQIQARAVKWENGQITDLNTVIPTNTGILLSSAVCINNNGQILCYADRPDPDHAGSYLYSLVILTPIVETSLVVNSVNDRAAQDATQSAWTGMMLADGTQEITLRSAIQFANQHPKSKYTIKFGIVSNGPPIINLDTDLDAVTVPITIDGTTQPGDNLVKITGFTQVNSFTIIRHTGFVLRGGNSLIRGFKFY